MLAIGILLTHPIRLDNEQRTLERQVVTSKGDIKRITQTTETTTLSPHYETYEVPYEYNHIPIKGGHITTPKYAYKADSKRDYTGIWKPSIHMPKEAARIWLEVTNVRVERVQEITAHECILEGISSEDVLYNTPVSGDFAQYTINQFKNLWNSINAKRGYGWETNPWVWVVSFKRLD